MVVTHARRGEARPLGVVTTQVTSPIRMEIRGDVVFLTQYTTSIKQ